MKPPLKIPVVKAEPPIRLGKTERIRKSNRVSTNISVSRVASTCESYRIGIDVPAHSWVVVSEVVVVKPGLPIEDLAGEAQVVGK
jgi:hypothetical protein